MKKHKNMNEDIPCYISTIFNMSSNIKVIVIDSNLGTTSMSFGISNSRCSLKDKFDEEYE
jgi:hypothetical protein